MPNLELFPGMDPLATGILPSQIIRSYIFGDTRRIISPAPIDDSQIQPASIDLRLGHEAFQVSASFLPGHATIGKKINDLLIRKIRLDDSAVFEPRSVFIVPLIESLRLPSDVSGRANPKSTTGRLDIFTRLITETATEFESVPKGYSGPLYLEVVSRTFPVRVRTGMKLNQLRFIRGNPPTSDGRLAKLAEKVNLAYDDDESPIDPRIERGLSVSVDLQGNGSSIIAYKAKRGMHPIDLDKAIDLDKVDWYNVGDFWEVVPTSVTRDHTLQPGDFYILASRERIRVPPTYAAEMVPFDPSFGEFRVHYAGFFDPGFGFGIEGEIPGTKAVLEVRAHELPILLEDGQLVGKLIYHKMAQTPDKVYGRSIGSSYQQQGLALSKQFKRGASSGPVASPQDAILAPPQLVRS
ncbi:MAG TPA: 2'-deoxycytidine 5'-triphosphate deaminase [Terriglobales bacterium]|nr:2'-deoxycytidine 5'-triphosphate deaminase [Terriglobales bacterium]